MYHSGLEKNMYNDFIYLHLLKSFHWSCYDNECWYLWVFALVKWWHVYNLFSSVLLVFDRWTQADDKMCISFYKFTIAKNLFSITLHQQRRPFCFISVLWWDSQTVFFFHCFIIWSTFWYPECKPHDSQDKLVLRCLISSSDTNK